MSRGLSSGHRDSGDRLPEAGVVRITVGEGPWGAPGNPLPCGARWDQENLEGAALLLLAGLATLPRSRVRVPAGRASAFP